MTLPLPSDSLSINAALPLHITGIQSNPTINVETANKFRLGVVQVGSNLSVSGTGVIDVLQASISQKGVVQLVDNVSNTSKCLALTANQGYLLQQQINSLSIATDLVFSGVFNPAISEMSEVSRKGQEVGFIQGVNLPLPSEENEGYFVVVAERGEYTPPSSVSSIDAYPGSWFLSNGSEWRYLKMSDQVPSATDTSEGTLRFASSQEAIDGVNDSAAMTALKVAEVAPALKDLSAKGDVYVASGSGSVSTLPVGADNQVLTACSSCPEGVYWGDADKDIPCSAITGRGSLVVGAADSSPASHALGLNNQYLRVNYSCPNGIEWATVTNNFAIPCAVLRSAGDLVTAISSGSPVALPRGSNGQFLISCPACTTTGGLTWADYTPPVLTSLQASCKGSLISTTGSESIVHSSNSALPGAILCYTGSGLSGLCYENNPPWVRCDLLENNQGALAVGAADSVVRLSSGNDGQVLTVNKACEAGVEWATPVMQHAAEMITSDTYSLGTNRKFEMVPAMAGYERGCWQINVWGSIYSDGDGKGFLYLHQADPGTEESPLQRFRLPSTATRVPFNLVWNLDNSVHDAWLTVCVEGGTVDIDANYTALRIGGHK